MTVAHRIYTMNLPRFSPTTLIRADDYSEWMPMPHRASRTNGCYVFTVFRDGINVYPVQKYGKVIS